MEGWKGGRERERERESYNKRKTEREKIEKDHYRNRLSIIKYGAKC